MSHEDEDGIEGPFNRAMDQSMRDDLWAEVQLQLIADIVAALKKAIAAAGGETPEGADPGDWKTHGVSCMCEMCL